MQQQSGSSSLFSMAGWLFTDLLLVIALLFLTSSTIARPSATDVEAAGTPIGVSRVATPDATPVAEPTATPTLEPTATPTPTLMPTATPTPEPTATPTPEPTTTPTPEPTATPSPTATTVPTATAEPTATPTCVQLLSPAGLEFTVEVDTDGLLNGDPTAQDAFLRTFQDQVNAEMAAQGLDSTLDTSQVGLVLTFGPSLQENAGRGTAVAAAINALIAAEEPFEDAVSKNYIYIVYSSEDLDVVEFEVFLYIISCG